MENGQLQQTPSLLGQIGNTVSGFFNWVGNGIKGIGEFLWDFANHPVERLNDFWKWVTEKPHEAIDTVLMVASVALIAVAIIASGGIAAGALAGLVALDIATAANILAKVAISGQPLDTFDLITLVLVGVANAGTIARGLKPVLKPGSKVGDLIGRTEANIGKLSGSQAVKAKIQKEIGKLKSPKVELPDSIREFQAIGTESVDWAARKAKAIKELSEKSAEQIKSDLDGLAKTVEGYGLVVQRLSIDDIKNLSLDKIYAVKKVLEQYRSTENIKTMLRAQGITFDRITKVSFKEIPGPKAMIASHNKNTGEITINLLKTDEMAADQIFFVVHHEVMHSADEMLALMEDGGKMVWKKVKVKAFSEFHIGTFKGKFMLDGKDVGINQLEDIINYKFMQKADPQRAKFFEDTYKKFISSRDEVKLIRNLAEKPSLSPDDIVKLKEMLDENKYQPKIAEWLAVKGDEADTIISALKNTVSDKQVLDSIKEIENLRDVYKEVMKLV